MRLLGIDLGQDPSCRAFAEQSSVAGEISRVIPTALAIDLRGRARKI
jgi:hypothetical protein